jgi:ubiquinone/menaquinone biosynthesis C-methylase UbiE
MSEVRSRFYSSGYYKGIAPEERFRKCAEIFQKFSGQRFLDIGCGDGDISLLLKESMGAQEAFGVDIAQRAVELANQKGIKAFLVDIDNQPLPFEDNYFDAIYCGEVIEHVFDPDNLLLEINRVLKPNGLFVLTTPNLAGWSNRFALFFGYQPFSMAVSPRNESLGKLLIKSSEGQWGHIRVFTLRALKTIVTLYGFNIKSVVGCSVTIKSSLPTITSRLILSFDKAMSRFPNISSRVILVLQKNIVSKIP